MTRSYSQRAGRPDRLVVIDCETIAPPAPDNGFPPWPLHDIIVTSLLSATRERYGQWQFELETVDFLSDPAKAIERVSHLLEGRTVIGFNSAGFDIPLLALTAMKHQRCDLAGISRAWQSHRYSGNSYDVADIVSGYGAARGGNLERLCGALGIPAKFDCHGDQVAELLAQGQHKKIAEYCETDCCATLFLFAMVEGLRSTDAGYSASLISQCSRWIADAGLAHLKVFERIPGSGEFDRQSLLAMLGEGIASLDHRQHLRFVNKVPGQSGLTIQSASDF